MTDIQKLLADYVNSGSEAAFRELSERYVDLVYSTAVRLVDGDSHLAEDVTQTVFLDFARLANTLSGEVRLGGWLHRHTCFVAAKILRGERRRRVRERQAMEINTQPDHRETNLRQIAPILDEVVNQLSATDRSAVLLRFYEKLDFRLIGEALGLSEAAAQKRVSRALGKLHGLLKHRGVALSIASLGAALASNVVTAAPAGLAASISTVALAGAAASSGTAFAILQIMAETKFKIGLFSLITLASIMLPLMVQRRSQAKLLDMDRTWREQNNQIARLTADNQRLANLIAKNNQLASNSTFSEILKLRGEVGSLRRRVRELASADRGLVPSQEDQLDSMKSLYAAQVGRLKQWFESNPSENIPELKSVSDQLWLDAVQTLAKDDDFARAASALRANAELDPLKSFWKALRHYAKENDGRFPSELSELRPYFSMPIEDAILQRYTIAPARSLASELQPGGEWVITQKAAANPALDMRVAIGITEMRSADERVTNRWFPVQ